MTGVFAAVLMASLVPLDPQSGLLVSIFHRGTVGDCAGPCGLGDLQTWLQVLASGSPDFFYIDSAAGPVALDWAGGDYTPTDQFLGAHAPPGAADTTPLQSTLIDLRGNVMFAAAGTYTLSLSAADDFAAVYLGGNGTPGSGQLLLARNADSSIASAPHLPNPITLSVSADGGTPFAIEIVYVNQFGGGTAELEFDISGPAPVTYTAPTLQADPLHLYQFLHTDCAGTLFDDTDRSDATVSNGVAKGGATVADGRLNTYATAWDQGGCLTGISFAGTSFSMEQWFQVNAVDANASGVQTLFSFATDTHNYLLARVYSDGTQDWVHVDLANRHGASASLAATDPLAGAQTAVLLTLTYDASAQVLAFYLNGKLQGAAPLGNDFSLNAVAANLYTGLNGFSVFGDPSLDGSSLRFSFFDALLSHDQILYDYALGY